MANNIVTATFNASHFAVTPALYRYNYGNVLAFVGIESLPEYFEVHFANVGDKTTTTQLGHDGQVTIPDELLDTGKKIVAYIYLHETAADGETVYKTIIPVRNREEPDDVRPTPEQQDVIAELIDALNTQAGIATDAAEQAAGSAESAEAWAVGERGGVPVEEGDPTYENNAKYYAEQAGADGGTTDYTALTNKPQINGVTLQWDKTAAQLGLAPEDIIAVQTETPSSDTQLWVNPDGTHSVIVPTMDDFDELTDDVADLKSALDEAIEDFAVPTQEAVDNWLGRHPEATTTVHDHSLTVEKLVNGTLNFVTPEMYGAKGDGVTDDTTALKTAFENGGVVFLKNGATYLVTDLTVENSENLDVIGYGATIKVKKEFEFIPYIQRCCLKLKNCTNVKFEGITFDASWREIKAYHNLEVDTTLENFCVRLLEGNDGVAFYKCIFGNQLKACLQAKGSYLGGDTSDPANIDSSFVPNKNVDIGYCTFGWNYTPGLHNCSIQFLELPTVATDVYHKIHDNLILCSGEHGMHIYYGNNSIVVENNVVLNSGHCSLEDYAQTHSVIGGYGIEFTSCNKITIKNNYVRNSVEGAIIFFGDGWYTAGDIYDITVEGNTVYQDEDYYSEFNGHGICFVDSESVIVTGNIAKGFYYGGSANKDLVGINLSSVKSGVVANNTVSECKRGINLLSCVDATVTGNTILNLKDGNNRRTYGIATYDIKRGSVSDNVINCEETDSPERFGVQLSIVNAISVSGNVLSRCTNGFVDGSQSIKNTSVYGNIFDNVTYKYVWWGTHTGLVIDFVAVADN